jgi:hypothetical protein
MSLREWSSKQWLLIFLLLAVLGFGGWWGWRNWHHPAPPPIPQTADEGLKTMQSDRFATASGDRQMAIALKTSDHLDALPDQELGDALDNQAPDDREATMEAMQEARDVDAATRYAQATPEEKQRLLDEQIDREEARSARFRRVMEQRFGAAATQPGGGGGPPWMNNGGGGGRGPGGPGWGGGRGGWRNLTPEQRKARILLRVGIRVEYGNPERAGLATEYRKILNDRRAARGLPTRG